MTKKSNKEEVFATVSSIDSHLLLVEQLRLLSLRLYSPVTPSLHSDLFSCRSSEKYLIDDGPSPDIRTTSSITADIQVDAGNVPKPKVRSSLPQPTTDILHISSPEDGNTEDVCGSPNNVTTSLTETKQAESISDSPESTSASLHCVIVTKNIADVSPKIEESIKSSVNDISSSCEKYSESIADLERETENDPSTCVSDIPSSSSVKYGGSIVELPSETQKASSVCDSAIPSSYSVKCAGSIADMSSETEKDTSPSVSAILLSSSSFKYVGSITDVSSEIEEGSSTCVSDIPSSPSVKYAGSIADLSSEIEEGSSTCVSDNPSSSLKYAKSIAYLPSETEEGSSVCESDISSSSCVKETRNIAVSSPATEEVSLLAASTHSSSPCTNKTETVGFSYKEEDGSPTFVSDISSSSCLEEAENIALPSLKPEESSSFPVAVKVAPSSIFENKPLKQQQTANESERRDETPSILPTCSQEENVLSSPVLLSESEVFPDILKGDKPEALLKIAFPISSSETPNEDASVVDAASSGECEESKRLVELDDDEEVPTSDLLQAEIMPVITTKTEESHCINQELDSLPDIEEVENDPSLNVSSSSSCSTVNSQYLSAISETYAEEEPSNEKVPLGISTETESADLIKTDILFSNVVAIPETTEDDTSEDDYSITEVIDSQLNKTMNSVSSYKRTGITKTRLTLDLKSDPSSIDQAFEQLLQSISRPTEDIDKTFSDVSSDLHKPVPTGRNYQNALSDHSNARSQSPEDAGKRVVEKLDSDTLLREVCKRHVPQSSLHTERQGTKYPASNLEPVKIFFDVLNSQQGDLAGETAAGFPSDSFKESQTNFDHEVESFIKDDSGADVDCASDSSSISVSPNPDISFFRTESDSASEACKREETRKVDEDLKRMDEFGFGEPLMVVTARQVRTYVDDAEQFQKRLERKKRLLRINPEGLEAGPVKEPDHCQFKPVACHRESSICKPLKPEPVLSPCSDAPPGQFFRSLERRAERRLSTSDHSSEFPLNMRVPHRRAFWDSKMAEPKSASPKRQPSIKVTGIVKKCKETLQTLSGSSESLSMAIDEDELPRSHRRKFQEAKCFFQNLEGRAKTPEARTSEARTPEPATPEVCEKPRSYPATVEERFKVTGVYQDVLGDGAAKTGSGAPLRGVPRRKAVVATLDSFRK